MLLSLLALLLAAPAPTQLAVARTRAILATTEGEIEVRLFEKEAPKAVANFILLAIGGREWTDPRTGQPSHDKLYDGTVFHRVIPGFMIQGGDPLGTGSGGAGYFFEDEFQSGRKFDKPGLVAMANNGPDRNSCQFFITEVPTPWLSGHHTIIGEVVRGLTLVGRIARKGNGKVTLRHVRIVREPE